MKHDLESKKNILIFLFFEDYAIKCIYHLYNIYVLFELERCKKFRSADET